MLFLVYNTLQSSSIGMPKKKKKNLLHILKLYHIYFINSFYNLTYISIFIFTYNLIK